MDQTAMYAAKAIELAVWAYAVAGVLGVLARWFERSQGRHEERRRRRAEDRIAESGLRQYERLQADREALRLEDVDAMIIRRRIELSRPDPQK